jgi:hypothetical protein
VPLGIGIFTYCSCWVGLTTAVPTLERDHASSTNLWYTSDQIVNTVKIVQKRAPEVYINDELAKPLMFAEGRNNPNSPLCNFLQFYGDFELYPSDGFNGGVGISGFRDTSNNQPNPMQPERQKYFMNFFRGKNDKQIAADQNKIMREALEEGRLVFAALQPSAASFFRNRFVTPGGFEMRLLAQWREPAKVSLERSTSQLDPLARGLPINPTRATQTYHLYQITKKPQVPTPAPALTPATKPTTKPAALNVAKKSTTAPVKQVAAATPTPVRTMKSQPRNLIASLAPIQFPLFDPPTTKPSK